MTGFDGETVSGFPALRPWHGHLPQKGPYAALVDFYDDHYQGVPVRVAVLLQPVTWATGQGMATVQVAETLELRETLARSLLLDTLWNGWFDMARALEVRACITNYALMDTALIKQLHGAGLRALVYTVNDPAEAQRLLALGIDGIITDAVDRFAPGDSLRD